MKKYIYITIALIFTGLITTALVEYKKLIKYKDLYITELYNVRAYEQENSELQNSHKQFTMTIDALSESRDSINQKLLAVTKQLKIKNKNIQSLQYQSSVIEKVDTIILKDTIFKENVVALDTIVGDNWYTMKLSLKYPSTIITTPSFKSEKFVVAHKRREYCKKPSKIFFIRWFQKKYTAIDVDVVEKNPYIENKEGRFVTIIE